MSYTQLTQCPHCKASFKATEEQLSVANGRVRCGACLNIFDAIAYRINDPEYTSDSSKVSAQDLALDDDHFFDDTIELENELLSDEANTEADIFSDIDSSSETNTKTSARLEEEIDDNALFADDPEEDKTEKGYKGSAKYGNDLDNTFLDLETSSDSPFKTDDLDEDVFNDEADSIDESWAASILDDLDEPQSTKIEPRLNTELKDLEKTDLPPRPEPIRHSQHEHLETATHKAPEETALFDTSFINKNELNSLKFQYEQDESSGFRWIYWSFLSLINLSLLAVLIAQASWYHYEKLVKYPAIAELYESACHLIGCTLPELVDTKKIDNRNLVVKSHPTIFHALIIETIITNQANYDQIFPAISLSFSDINNKVIAYRTFTPNEYLNKELQQWKTMPSKQPIQISLEIIDPGPQAVNYKVDFYPVSALVERQKNDQMSTNKNKI